MKDIRKDFEQLKINYGLIQKNYLHRSETKGFDSHFYYNTNTIYYPNQCYLLN